MRIPVFARRANPAVDRPILRKSRVYVEGEVAAGRANWVDSDDPAQGIICRELLYFGPRIDPPSVSSPDDPAKLPPLELPGLIFVPPALQPGQAPTFPASWSGD